MQINQEKVKERLAGVPDSHRSHIYDASIVLEFLVATFMPTKFFLPQNFSPTPGIQLGANSMRKVSDGKEMSLRDLYDLYLLFREEKDYTSKIESRYIFGIIVRHLRYYKNRWEFITWRVGTAQIWHIGPLVMRKDVSAEDRNRFAAKLEETGPEGKEVEADPVANPDEVEESESSAIGRDLAEEGADQTVITQGEKIVAFFDGSGQATALTSEGRFIEAAPDFVAKETIEKVSRWAEANFEPDVHSEPAPLDDY